MYLNKIYFCILIYSTRTGISGQFYEAMTRKMLEKLPFKNMTLANMAFLGPILRDKEMVIILNIMRTRKRSDSVL